MTEECKEVGCGAPVKIRGYCEPHYRHKLKTGEIGRVKRPDGSGSLSTHGYQMLTINYKHRAEHTLVAERVLGKALPRGAVVHHWDENKLNNTPTNLAVFPDRVYHNLIHQRMRAYEACGNADYRKCCHCQRYDDPLNLIFKGNTPQHRKCASDYEYQRLGRLTTRRKYRLPATDSLGNPLNPE